MNKQKKITLLAIERNYIIDDRGFVYRNGNKLKGSITKEGYLKFNIRNKDNETHPVYFHRLQAYQKFGEKIFEEGIQVRHLNSNKTDNSWDNIDIGSRSDNMMDRSPECRKRSAVIAIRKKQDSIRSYEERCLIYQDLKNGISYNKISKSRNIAKSTLSDMKNKSQEYKEYLIINDL